MSTLNRRESKEDKDGITFPGGNSLYMYEIEVHGIL